MGSEDGIGDLKVFLINGEAASAEKKADGTLGRDCSVAEDWRRAGDR